MACGRLSAHERVETSTGEDEGEAAALPAQDKTQASALDEKQMDKQSGDKQSGISWRTGHIRYGLPQDDTDSDEV